MVCVRHVFTFTGRGITRENWHDGLADVKTIAAKFESK